MSIITDEMVEAGLKGSCMYYDDGTCAKPCYACNQDVRNCLNAVAPLIRAAALEKAAQCVDALSVPDEPARITYWMGYADGQDVASEAIRALKETGDE